MSLDYHKAKAANLVIIDWSKAFKTDVGVGHYFSVKTAVWAWRQNGKLAKTNHEAIYIRAASSGFILHGFMADLLSFFIFRNNFSMILSF